MVGYSLRSGDYEMQRGRKPKPTWLKIVEGNPGKRPLNEREPRPKMKAPERPKWLKGVARKEWEWVVPMLERLRIITEIDKGILVGYCVAYAALVDAEKKIKKHGDLMRTPSGYLQQSPYVGMRNRALDQLRKFESELGMSPSSRSRIVTGDFGNDEGGEDLLTR